MNTSRDFVDVKATETDIISLGFSVAGVAGMGDSYVYVLEEGDAEVIIQLWVSTSAYKYSMYAGVWPSNTHRVDTDTVRTYEDVRSLLELAEEALQDGY